MSQNICKIEKLHEVKNYADNFHLAQIVVKTGKRITVEMFGRDVEVDEVNIWNIYTN